MARRLNPLARAAWLPRVLAGCAVLLLHLLVAHHLPLAPVDSELPPRLQVVYLHEMKPTQAPTPSAALQSSQAPQATRPLLKSGPSVLRAPSPASPAASEPLSAASAPLPDELDAALGSTALPDRQELAAGPASKPSDSAVEPGSSINAEGNTAATPLHDRALLPETTMEAAGPPPNPSEAPAFDWPVSTRLSYVLGGHYRGEVHGSAQVEWINAAPRYQVNLDVTVGLSFAPLFTRHMRSDGRMVAQGLQPERYAEASQLAFRAPQRASLRIDADGVRDASGRRMAVHAMAGPLAVQDSASQFVQLSWLFTVDPGLLTPGRLIEFDLALPRRVVRWVYQVGQPQTIYTPFGAVEAVHVQPRPGTERGSDLLAQAWFAPSLANLPVRIRIEQSADVYLDLVLERRPELAAR